jgi:shikimate 5-dehydrogenase
MAGHDLPLHEEPRRYRDVVEAIRSGPLELGGLVTTHKIDLFNACRDLFDHIDPDAELCGEVPSLSKLDGLFRAHAKDPISSGRLLDEFVEPGYWGRGALLFGAGGSSLAITLHLLSGSPSEERPQRIVVVNRSDGRLTSMRAVYERLSAGVRVQYVCKADPHENDRLLETVPPGSLVVNGTGMGKDTPGSPITNDAVFPKRGLVWKLNYRGNSISSTRRSVRARREVSWSRTVCATSSADGPVSSRRSSTSR